MSIFASRFSLAFLLLVALCPGARTAHAQAAPVQYWLPSWPIGFGGSVGQDANGYANFAGLGGNGFQSGGVSSTRYNFPNGWFVGSEGGGLGLGMTGTNPYGTFSNLRSSLYYEGVQFGYNFKDSSGLPLTVYAGIDTLKYNPGIGNPFTSFNSAASGTLPGYSAHAGVEYQAAPNVSLSLGVGYTQQSGRIDSDINSSALPGASPFAFGGRR